ncbi:hypothetical protein Vretimale_8907 [Volvox reticuliferus]|uniref:Uncharacterized protein n=1 Tax=Volvox reticuliferus TaxID=1737510 RepID=A0A8J4CLX3_9CHLO|nr:hypothetical protein Vretifemale_14404 [Volvox reticuliferus]GIM04330.1 hypothetical protein Vretimale_8907 [Volvox reticuliferus]
MTHICTYPRGLFMMQLPAVQQHARAFGHQRPYCMTHQRRAPCLPWASSSPDPTPSPEPALPSASEPAAVSEASNLTTWQYAKLKDPGFGPWFIGMAFLPFVLLLVPLLSSPPMPPAAAP